MPIGKNSLKLFSFCEELKFICLWIESSEFTGWCKQWIYFYNEKSIWNVPNGLLP